ncbi:hypothetical protein EII34_08975 [Arachnia propionica]|uniref:Peptidase M15C domain-containing protein n=1 Tax=Arachnia propionica TaxID=1750 RepID=A0A3P1T581_9ACTN|nr:M15 family metallopeptidase [Arachnia propionica]RRD04667.1 hypothetical protein EII34_08975 [Arachnia propionica]
MTRWRLPAALLLGPALLLTTMTARADETPPQPPVVATPQTPTASPTPSDPEPSGSPSVEPGTGTPSPTGSTTPPVEPTSPSPTVAGGTDTTPQEATPDAMTSLEVGSTGPVDGDLILAGNHRYRWTGRLRSAGEVVIWWNNPSYDTTWRRSAQGHTDEAGNFSLSGPVGPWSNTYRFTVTSGAEPAGSASPVVTVRVRSTDDSLAVDTDGERLGSRLVGSSGNYVATGLAPAGSAVVVWWNNPAVNQEWLPLTRGTADARGRFTLIHPIGPWANTFRMAATTGDRPTAATSHVTVEVVGPYVSLAVRTSGHHHGTTFAVNSGWYIFEGGTAANAPVQLWWDAVGDGGGWREGASGRADATGHFRIVSKVGPWAKKYRWTATTGPAPDGRADVTTVDVVQAPSQFRVGTTGEMAGGNFRAGSGSYVFEGRTIPGVPVQVWWNNPDYDPWFRTQVRTTADGQGNFRVTAPIGPWAATFRFAATVGEYPEAWDAAPVAVKVVTAALDPVVVQTPASELGSSWRPGCPVGPGSLSSVYMNHWRPDGTIARGEIVVRSDLAQRTIAIFDAAFQEEFPITKMQPAANYHGANDELMMADDNTSGFNCRTVVGNPYRMSPHSYGYAIDINTVKNPYYAAGRWYPSSRYSTGRSASIPGMHMPGTVFPSQFRAHGGHWGNCYRDYHHFELTTKRC